VPNLILQPLVENAIRHGIVQRVGSGRIEISASRDDRVLRLSVRDNGPGLRADAAPGSRHGLGFALTRARLERLYGARQSLRFTDAPGGGLEVTLELPFVAPDAAEPIIALSEGAAAESAGVSA
jgi:LytS/YehU family sensor histidine kinase